MINMRKLLEFEMNEFFDLIKEIMNGINIEQITTNIKHEVSEGEEITVDCIDLKIKKPLGHAIKTITDIVGYSDIKQDIEDGFVIISIELTDLTSVISKAIGEQIIESYEIFEANFDDDFKEHISFHLA